MSRRPAPSITEKIPCDVKAGLGKNAHSPISPIAAEEANTLP